MKYFKVIWRLYWYEARILPPIITRCYRFLFCFIFMLCFYAFWELVLYMYFSLYTATCATDFMVFQLPSLSPRRCSIQLDFLTCLQIAWAIRSTQSLYTFEDYRWPTTPERGAGTPSHLRSQPSASWFPSLPHRCSFTNGDTPPRHVFDGPPSEPNGCTVLTIGNAYNDGKWCRASS